MITRKNLWFLTLFSIILVMATYYISVPGIEDGVFVNKEVSDNDDLSINVNESDSIMALKISRDSNLQSEVDSIKEILLDNTKTSEEKSDAYETLKTLNVNKGKEEKLEKAIKEKFNYDAFVEINGSKVKVVVDSKTHSYDLANKIISTIQSEFDNNMYVTVNFASK